MTSKVHIIKVIKRQKGIDTLDHHQYIPACFDYDEVLKMARMELNRVVDFDAVDIYKCEVGCTQPKLIKRIKK